MSKFYDELVEGLNEAIAFASGKDTGARVHTIDVPVIDVAAIRAKTGLSQSQFAKSIGVAKGTLLNWEHGRRRPTGPAQVLLAMIARRPSVVTELLRAA
ncbi:NadS family protein [Novosphingobium sp.]|uniref:NadS family protein n=1 Tax=Novosphingobium sp. TaxID=1874826 RepID=UPI00286BB44B|nr:NadS family protein [Novosphingobium sp.]